MASESKSRILTDHDEIRRWAEERGAKPAVVQRTHDTEGSGIIRLDFPGYSGEGSLEPIEWNEWFEDFDDNQLALLVQDQTADGEQSSFNKLVKRENAEQHAGSTSHKKSAGTRGSGKGRSTGKSRSGSSRKTASKSSSHESSKSTRSRKSGESEKTNTGRSRRTGHNKAA